MTPETAEKPEEPEEHDSSPPQITKSMPGTMVLVIGIILGAFVAMILIVIIVLKMRTRVDSPGNGISVKCEEAPRYQFSAPPPPNDYGEMSAAEQDTVTSSLIADPAGAVPSVSAMAAANHANNNGFFSAFAHNGDRSRLFRKSNGSKPVREWYV